MSTELQSQFRCPRRPADDGRLQIAPCRKRWFEEVFFGSHGHNVSGRAKRLVSETSWLCHQPDEFWNAASVSISAGCWLVSCPRCRDALMTYIPLNAPSGRKI